MADIDYEGIEDAMLNAAMGFDYSKKTMSTLKDRSGEVVQARGTMVERREKPDISELRRILSDRIGGPQDWC